MDFLFQWLVTKERQGWVRLKSWGEISFFLLLASTELSESLASRDAGHT